VSKSPVVELKSVEGAPIRNAIESGISSPARKDQQAPPGFPVSRAHNHHQQKPHTFNLCLKRRTVTLKIRDRSSIRLSNGSQTDRLPAVSKSPVVELKSVEAAPYGMQSSRNSSRASLKDQQAPPGFIRQRAIITHQPKPKHLNLVSQAQETLPSGIRDRSVNPGSSNARKQTAASRVKVTRRVELKSVGRRSNTRMAQSSRNSSRHRKRFKQAPPGFSVSVPINSPINTNPHLHLCLKPPGKLYPQRYVIAPSIPRLSNARKTDRCQPCQIHPFVELKSVVKALQYECQSGRNSSAGIRRLLNKAPPGISVTLP